MKIQRLSEIDKDKYKMQINSARVRETGENIWYVSFASHKPCIGYYQEFRRPPTEYDIIVTYNNFLELLKRAHDGH